MSKEHTYNVIVQVFTIFLLLFFSLLQKSLALAALTTTNAKEKEIKTKTASYSSAVNIALPAVVSVYAKKIVNQDKSTFESNAFSSGALSSSSNFFVPIPQNGHIVRALGSGVILTKEGLIVTNSHVVQKNHNVKVSLNDGRQFSAKIIFNDSETDLAILKIKTTDRQRNFPFIIIKNSKKVQVGDVALAIGNPFNVGQTVTMGIVSAIAQTKIDAADYHFYIQTDAAINPGNSGGALIDTNGQLIGINVAIVSKTGNNIGIGLAIPADLVRVALNNAMSGEKSLTRPWIGADLQNVNNAIAKSLGLTKPRGALITAMSTNSPLKKAGLNRGAIILFVNNNPIKDSQSLLYQILLAGIGKIIDIQYLAQHKMYTTHVRFIKAPMIPSPNKLFLNNTNSPLDGATAANLSPSLAEQLKINMTTLEHGIIITKVENESYAQRIGFQRGDVIFSINQKNINDMKELKNVLQSSAENFFDSWNILLIRNNEKFILRIK